MQGKSRWMDCLWITRSKCWSLIKMLEFQGLFVNQTVRMLEFLGLWSFWDFCEPDKKNWNLLVLLWNTRSKCWNYHDFFRTCTVEMLDFLGFCEPISRMQDLWGFLVNHTVKMLELLGYVCDMTRSKCWNVNHMVKMLEILFVNSTLKIKAQFSFWPVAHRNRLIWLVVILSWVFFQGTTIEIFSLQI